MNKEKLLKIIENFSKDEVGGKQSIPPALFGCLADEIISSKNEINHIEHDKIEAAELTDSLDQLTEETFFEDKEDSKAYPLLLYYTVLDGTNISTPDCPFIGRTGQHGIVKKVSIGSQYCVNKCPYKCNHFPKDKEIWCMFKERQVGEPGEK